MKQYLLFMLFAFCACRNTCDPELSIEGKWSQIVPQNPPRTFEFRNGVVTQQTLFAGTPVATLEFVYATQGDTVLIGGDGQNAPRTWVIRLIGDGAMEAHELPQTIPGLGRYFIFERL